MHRGVGVTGDSGPTVGARTASTAGPDPAWTGPCHERYRRFLARTMATETGEGAGRPARTAAGERCDVDLGRISWDHRALHETARAFLLGRCPPAVPRADLDDADDHLPPFWADMAALGWFGIHLPEAVGGDGAGLLELAIVLEELGRVVAPGPFLPTVLAAAVVDRLGDDRQREAWLPDLAHGTTPAAVAFGTGPGTLAGATLTGRWSLVPGAGLAQLVLVPARLAEPADDDAADERVRSCGAWPTETRRHRTPAQCGRDPAVG